MKLQFCKPKGQVRRPEKNMMPMDPKGDYVDIEDPFYARRIRAGDIVVADPPTESADKAARRSKEK